MKNIKRLSVLAVLAEKVKFLKIFHEIFHAKKFHEILHIPGGAKKRPEHSHAL